MKFKNKFAHKSNYGSARPLSNIKYIVIHFTGNKGDTALNNCKYFQSANRHASAHCFVDGSGTVYKSVSLKRVAWSVGGFYSRKNGAGSFYKKCTNANSLSIEMCNSVTCSGAFHATAIPTHCNSMDGSSVPLLQTSHLHSWLWSKKRGGHNP